MWQSVSAAAVLAALGVAVVAVARGDTPWAGLAGAGFGALVLVRVLVSGHRVGTSLRADRRRHRQLVDALGDHTAYPGNGAPVRVLAHPTPTAYCLPGLRQRVVLSEGTLAALPPDELAAVLAHERAHLVARHDLVVEFFTVLHRAAPGWLRAPAALREVRLLVEVLADRAARRATGAVPLARALVTLAGGSQPGAALGAGAPDAPTPSSTRARMSLLVEREPAALVRAALALLGCVVLVIPVVLVVAALG